MRFCISLAAKHEAILIEMWEKLCIYLRMKHILAASPCPNVVPLMAGKLHQALQRSFALIFAPAWRSHSKLGLRSFFSPC
jgi:hypothetical protein